MRRVLWAQEVSLDFRFGYPLTDSLGNGFMVYGDTLPGAARHDMTSWLRAFPRQFVLGPGEQQTVRLTVRPQRELADGVYWTRLVTTSAPRAPRVDSLAEGVAAQIVFRLEQITTVLFRQGEIAAVAGIGEPTVRIDSAQAAFLVPVRREGSAPLFAMLSLRVVDAGGRTVGEGRQGIAVYFDGIYTFALDRSALPAGEYSAEVTLSPERADIPPAERIDFPPVTRRVGFRVTP
ncbi:MAG: hypothetical protein ACRELD_11085 [Longimicrobiales bacterium]